MSALRTLTSGAPGSLHPPAGRPARRLDANRTMLRIYQFFAIFLALMTVVTAILHEWPGTAICGVAAPAFWGLARLFKRQQIAIYGSELWVRDALRRWHAPLDLAGLTHVAFVRDVPGRLSTVSLLLQAAAPDVPASVESRLEWSERQELRLSLRQYSRRALERLIAPWVVARPGIASAELTRAFDLRAKHPRTAGIRMLLRGH
jgi:hypothetical protein